MPGPGCDRKIEDHHFRDRGRKAAVTPLPRYSKEHLPKGPFCWFRANPESASVSSVPISSKVGMHSARGKEARATDRTVKSLRL